ncbi:MAG: flagellar hook-length control protein FliK [Butyrivibrio sp.]|nr:flagellar hook-length control protein FliK [Butyrivibrio sp.]
MSGIRGVVNTNTNVITHNNLNQTPSAEVGKNLTLSAGDTVSGKIVSITNSEDGSRMAQIDLGDNSQISAKLNDSTALSQGQTVAFLVRSTASNTLTLSPLFENTAVDPNTLKALSAAGIDINNSSVEMVSKMMENGMSIDKSSLGAMYNLVHNNPQTSASTIVDMTYLGLEVSPDNIKSYEAYKNYEHQVLNEMNSIMDKLPQAFDSLTASGDIQAANDLFGNVLHVITGNSKVLEALNSEGEAPAAENAVDTKAAMQAENPESGEVLADGKNVLSQEGALADKNQGTTVEGNILTGSDIKNDMNQDEIIKGDVREPLNNITDNSQQTFISNDFVQKLNDVNPKLALELQNMLSKGNNKLSESDLNKLMKELSNEYLNSPRDEESIQSWSKLFSTNDFKNLMKEQISSQWLLKPEDVRDKENVDKLYERINEQTKEMAHVLEKSLGAEHAITKSAQNLNKDIDFMNQLNQMFTYVQLPLKMANQNAHGDLYVYRNKKHARSEDGSVSAILHLDMEHLGPLDVYVKMTDNKVKTNFYVADDSVIDLIAANIDKLDERLNKRGYSMEAKLMLHTDMESESKDAPVDEMLDIQKLSVVSYASFDARA